jgi:H+/Cl- antiporter ClcA
MQNQLKRFSRTEQVPIVLYLIRWFTVALFIGALVGSCSAFFLWALDLATDYREDNLWIIALLPLSGLIIGLLYHYYGQDVVGGNNQILEEFYNPSKVIPLKMAPFVLFGTVATHLFGGSAGREGTAVQMGGAIADQFTRLFGFKRRDRRILLTMGVAAGFASVFGTPLAGAVFALEVLIVGRMRYEAILPSFLAAVLADYFCNLWGTPHTVYSIAEVPEMNVLNVLYTAAAGIAFALAALTFSKATHFSTATFNRLLAWPPLRPVVGGAVIALIVWAMGSTRYIGLGIPVILESFDQQVNSYDFILKIAFTAFTLGAGFKGGEVTPLFFIGATLGSALFGVIPLPIGLLAGMGFVAVFAGATNTPIACTLMGIELFGIESGVFIAIACVVAYLFSGHTGIYGAQVVGSPKHQLFLRNKSKSIKEI